MSVQLTRIDANQRLADYVLDLASKTESSERPYWKMISCRRIDGYEDGRALRIFRMDGTKKWEWKDDPLSRGVRHLVEPFVHHYTSLTRVMLLVQKPNEEVYCHTDRITGQEYAEGVCMGKYEDDWLKYRDQCNADPLQHQKQHYLGGRLSLGPVGLSYTLPILSSPVKTYYQTENQFFFLNENVFHGADPVDYWRGVVFFDGIYNPEIMQKYYDFQ